MSETVLIIATTMSAIAAVLSFLNIYLHNRPLVVVTLEEQKERTYGLVATNLSSTAAARNMNVSVVSMPESYSEMWAQVGVQPGSEWNIRFLAPGEAVPLTSQSARVVDAEIKEEASRLFRHRYNALVTLAIRPDGLFSRHNPFSRTECPISFKEPRVVDLGRAREMQAADTDSPVKERPLAKILADEIHHHPSSR